MNQKKEQDVVYIAVETATKSFFTTFVCALLGDVIGGPTGTVAGAKAGVM